jgi:hypothetical protein
MHATDAASIGRNGIGARQREKETEEETRPNRLAALESSMVLFFSTARTREERGEEERERGIGRDVC